MKLFFISLTMLGLSLPVFGVDVVNGERINKYCALCHGVYGQGAPGDLSPRIAGLPKEYLIKAMKDHRDSKRLYPLMVRTAGLKEMSESDYEDIATYLTGLDLSSDKRFNVAAADGSVDQGKEIYRKDCKSCHARDGYGRPKEKAPPLAGQHPAYLYTTMNSFKKHMRVHGIEPEDDFFDDYKTNEMISVIAYLSTMDDQKIVEGCEFTPPVFEPAAVKKEPVADGDLEITDIKQTMVKMLVKDGVSKKDAAKAMQSKAIELNLKLVDKQMVSDEIQAGGLESPHISSYQFCDPLDTREMLVSNPILFSYTPCQISMVEDSAGKTWLMMLNMDMLVNTKPLSGDVVKFAMKINQQMLDIMLAGSTGKL